MSKVTLHMVSSLDGFIANKEGTIDWLQSNNYYKKGKKLSPQEIELYLDKIDCYIMGSITYLNALEYGWPYGQKPCTVLSTKDHPRHNQNVRFFNGEASNLISELSKSWKNIWVVGGSKVARNMLNAELIDEIIISVMPVLLGSGLRFFEDLERFHNLHLLHSETYDDGMVELTYQVLKNE